MVLPGDEAVKHVKQCKEMELFNKSQLSCNLLSTFCNYIRLGKAAGFN